LFIDVDQPVKPSPNERLRVESHLKFPLHGDHVAFETFLNKLYCIQYLRRVTSCIEKCDPSVPTNKPRLHRVPLLTVGV